MKKIFFGITLLAGAFFGVFWPAHFSLPAMADDTDALSSIYQAPTSTTITLGTSNGSVVVNNFYTAALGAEDEFVVLARNTDYEIDYNANDSSFDLDINPAYFSANRTAAEANFLSLLGANQTSTCNLTVAVSETLASSSLRIPLSFCQ